MPLPDLISSAVMDAIGDALEFGWEMGYGTVTIELKFADGKPQVAIVKRETSSRVENGETAERINAAIAVTERSDFDGQQQFVVHYKHGRPDRVVVTESEAKAV